jgi:endonuclease III
MQAITPTRITNFNRNDYELQSFWLFSMFVAGKNSDYASKCLARLLNKDVLPFEYLQNLGEVGIHNALVASRIGQYNRLTKAILDSLNLDLRNCSLEDLLQIRGVGPKTARFFLLHTRQNCECAVLDTHILAWMRDNGVDDAPESTPQNQKLYQQLEKQFLFLAKHNFPHMSVAQIDLMIWMKQSGRLKDEI